jgi:branched-chain amino acid transport system substrate-binding protein
MKIRRASSFLLSGFAAMACSFAPSSDPSDSSDPDPSASNSGGSGSASSNPDTTPPDAVPGVTDPETVRVGFAHPMTGALATAAATFERAIRLAQDQINSNGGIRGKKLELVVKDSQTNGDIAAKVGQELLSDHITSIVTDEGTAGSLALLGVTVPASAVLVVGSAQATALARPENNGLFFRPGSNTLQEAGPLAATIVADGHASLGVISSTLPYATSFYAEFEKSFLAASCSAGPCKVAQHGTYDSKVDLATFDFSPLVTEALASQPDALLVAGYASDAKAVLKAVWDAGYRGSLYITAAAGNQSLAADLPAEQAAQIKWATVEGVSSPSMDFVSKLWVDAGNAASDFVGPAHSNYDAMFLLGLALAHANSEDGKTIAASMRAVANGPGEPIYAGDWAKALTAIQNGQDIDYVGVTSDITLDDLGNNSHVSTVIKGFRDGQAVVL